MEKVKVSRKKWHYKFVTWLDKYNEPKDTCTYGGKFLANCLFIVLVTAIAGFVVYCVGMILHILYEISKLPMGPAFFIALGFVISSVGISIFTIKTIRKKYGEPIPMPDNVLKECIESIKKRTCKKIEYTD